MNMDSDHEDTSGQASENRAKPDRGDSSHTKAQYDTSGQASENRAKPDSGDSSHTKAQDDTSGQASENRAKPDSGDSSHTKAQYADNVNESQAPKEEDVYSGTGTNNNDRTTEASKSSDEDTSSRQSDGGTTSDAPEDAAPSQHSEDSKQKSEDCMEITGTLGPNEELRASGGVESETSSKEIQEEPGKDVTSSVFTPELIHGARGSSSDVSESTPEVIQNSGKDVTSRIWKKYAWVLASLGVIILAWLAGWFSAGPTTPEKKEPSQMVVETFLWEMEKIQSRFPSQHPELWRRSKIHLRRHLQMSHPTEPVSLILTSGLDAEKTLGCLANGLASAFSKALNASVLDINGVVMATQDSDQVKLDIDTELRKAFDGSSPAAVIHRFEEIPPGATLIFYRYCDHENAAYKNVFLAFTVLLGTDTLGPGHSLSEVEEMVQEHIKDKFIPSDSPKTFNQMDIDKLSGLWSRISHLVLPVAAEELVEQQGCPDL
ncbi:torsin-1A-interacting protein 2-like [Chanos chanos]|uniref:Torsin-1A-interacting protein 2-like n=1 Tax=Chanos chanos TaxID=29144 RepID=A0A6J2W7F4_CHACN|nr:torsin-1A-interacting protein 2-like [Chanos chanos]